MDLPSSSKLLHWSFINVTNPSSIASPPTEISQEEALNLLFLGDTNRTIAETPMNQASSRSHCVFTVHIESRKPGEDIVRRRVGLHT